MSSTLIRFITIVIATADTLVAQQPARPARPAPPAREVEPARPARPPRVSETIRADVIHDRDMQHQVEELRVHAQDLRLHATELAHLGAADMRIDADAMRLQAEELRASAANMRIDVDAARLQAEALRLNAADVRMYAENAVRGAFTDISRIGAVSTLGDKLLDSRPRAAWASEDPADSLYRRAREALNNGEYRRAATLFNEVVKKFPKSQYAQDCTYWEAFSRYRAGTTDDLRQALKILDENRAVLQERRNGESSIDAQTLRTRVQGALAARGDADAAKRLQSEARQSDGCDREEVSVRAEALGALGQMDIQAAMPTIKKVLARKDECSVELRRRALYILARQSDAQGTPLVLDVARNDPDANIRGEAMMLLPRIAGDNAVPLLEDVLKTSNDERSQRNAVQALGAIDSDRARKAVRAIIERNDAPERLRYDAILGLVRQRDNRTISPDDAGYIRSLYGKVESARLKEAVLSALSRIGTSESDQFLLTVARNENETASLRATALQRLGMMSSVSVNEIAKLYDVADSRSMREQILSALNQRKESEATDKMMDIVKKDTDPAIRRYAISMLIRRNDPRATKLLQELIDK